MALMYGPEAMVDGVAFTWDDAGDSPMEFTAVTT
jgi:hypothetical protein